MVKNFTKPVQWDTEKSFYKWKIYLTNGHSFPGYSKGKDSIEIPDKIKMLFRIVTRLRKAQEKYPKFIQGYFTPKLVERVEFFRNTGIGLYEEKLMTFYPTYYKFHQNERFNNSKEVKNFFVAFYKELLEGKIITPDTTKNQMYLGIGYSKSIDERKYFSLDASRFKNVTELDAFIGEALTNSYTYELVGVFRSQYIEKNFSHGRI